MITKDSKPVVTIYKPYWGEHAQKIEISSACYCGIAKKEVNLHRFADFIDSTTKSVKVSAQAVCNIPFWILVLIEKFGVPFAPSRFGYLLPTKYADTIGGLVNFISKFF